MKKQIALITALCLALVSLPAQGEAPPTPIPGYTLRESSGELIVFAIRSLKANIVGYLTPNDANDVHVLSVDGEWCYISFPSTYGTGYGYVPLSYFELAATPTNAPYTDTQPAIQAGTPAWVINAAEGYRLNLRAEPAATSKSLGKYFTGTPVILTGNVTSGYAQVRRRKRRKGGHLQRVSNASKNSGQLHTPQAARRSPLTAICSTRPLSSSINSA